MLTWTLPLSTVSQAATPSRAHTVSQMAITNNLSNAAISIWSIHTFRPEALSDFFNHLVHVLEGQAEIVFVDFARLSSCFCHAFSKLPERLQLRLVLGQHAVLNEGRLHQAFK